MNSGAAAEKSSAQPSFREAEGYSVSLKAVIAPVIAIASAAASAPNIHFAALPFHETGARPAPHHAVSAIAASISRVLIRCADKYTARPMEALSPTYLNKTRPAPSSASVRIRTSDAAAAWRTGPFSNARNAQIAIAATEINARPVVAR